MLKRRINKSALIKVNEAYEAEPLEYKIKRVMTSGEPLGDEVPIIYTARKEGVLPGYDIRTDRFDVAIDAMGKIDKTWKAQRAERIQMNQTTTGTEG